MAINTKSVVKNVFKAVIAAVSAIILAFTAIFVSVLTSLLSVNGDLYFYIIFAAAILAEVVIIGALWGIIKKKAFFIPVCVSFAVCVAAWAGVAGYGKYLDNVPTLGEDNILLYDYVPYADGSKVAELDGESGLSITGDLPVMDGATALYPVYSGFAKALYPEKAFDGMISENGEVVHINENDVLKCSTTSNAYYNIVTGDADIIFAALPSDEQKQFAEDNGVELVYTPIGREAFVFFVNSKNPLENITLEDIQKIYSGEITEWSELGVSGLGKIKAFQRDEGSGSQSTLKKLMADKELMEPPQEDVIGGMGGIIEKTADYKNFRNAIGYTFRFYATEMVGDNQIKLLSVNGVYPEIKNIENGTYPIASYFYAVTRSDADENTLKILDWIQGEQGQKIVELTGYTPLEK